jgi:hypothetical protein
MNFVMRNGKKIEVETIDDAKPRRRSREAFVMVPLNWAAAAAKATNTQQAFVCILILYGAWKSKGAPFALTNARLRQAKIDPHVKWRALDALEGAGLIKVERNRGRAPIITLST